MPRQQSNMKPAAAIFVLVIMVLSVAGFSLNSATFQQAPQQPDFPSVIREPLDTQEQISILRSGRVLIQHLYSENCSDCLEKNARLEEFASRLQGYVVINEVQGEEQRLEMIGSGGRITDISGSSLEYEDLVVPFCEVAIAQPRVCILMSVNSEQDSQSQGNETSLNETA